MSRLGVVVRDHDPPAGAPQCRFVCAFVSMLWKEEESGSVPFFPPDSRIVSPSSLSSRTHPSQQPSGPSPSARPALTVPNACHARRLFLVHVRRRSCRRWHGALPWRVAPSDCIGAWRAVVGAQTQLGDALWWARASRASIAFLAHAGLRLTLPTTISVVPVYALHESLIPHNLPENNVARRVGLNTLFTPSGTRPQALGSAAVWV